MKLKLGISDKMETEPLAPLTGMGSNPMYIYMCHTLIAPQFALKYGTTCHLYHVYQERERERERGREREFLPLTSSKWGKDTFTPIGALITMALDVKGYFKAEDQGSWANVTIAQGWQNGLLGRIPNTLPEITAYFIISYHILFMYITDFCNSLAA